ncbi:MAG: exo-alpha-sialidase [Deltaproteobacteria bacterium]|nr:exo-alpha-sialidase [Deltaproteobacteria bacterium]
MARFATAANRLAVAPFNPRVEIGSTQSFHAIVSGNGDTPLQWTVSGGPINGVITNEGLFTAPKSLPPDNHIEVCATDTRDAAVVGCVPVTLTVGPPWTAAREVAASTTTGAQSPPMHLNLALGAQRGHLHVVFVQGGRVVYAASRDGGVSWQAPKVLSHAGAVAHDPVLATTLSDQLFVAWREGDAATYFTRSLDGGEQFESPTLVEEAVHSDGLSLQVKLDETADEILLSFTSGENSQLRVLRGASDGTAWQPVAVQGDPSLAWYDPVLHQVLDSGTSLWWSDGDGETAGSQVSCAEDTEPMMYTMSTNPGAGGADFAPAVARYWQLLFETETESHSKTETHVVWLHNATPGDATAEVSLRYGRYVQAANACAALETPWRQLDDPAVGTLLLNHYRPAIATDLEGRVAVAYYARVAGKTWLVARESRDHGATWGDAVKVNQGAPGQSETWPTAASVTHAPAIAYDDGGRLYVLGLVDSAGANQWALRLWVLE